jgi:hypothetical protein
MSGNGIIPFNPLDKQHLAESVCQAMLRRPVVPMARLTQFEGVGIYAIYYCGDFPAYQPIAARNLADRFAAPIYVGKAVPKGSRKGGGTDSATGRELWTRLAEHARSLEEAENLHVADFHCRYLAVDDIWIPLGESLLIARFNPLWNTLIDGFGNHNPGRGRHAGRRPRWDVLHPGRSWAERCQERSETAEQIASEAREYLRSNPPPTGI